MTRNKLLMAVAAIALMAGSGGAFAQQEPAHGATGERVATKMAPTNSGDASLVFDTTPGDHARLREIFGKDRSALRVDHVRFNLSVGTVVPRSIRLVALPQTIVDIQPTWQGNEYFRVGHQILIVDPQSKKIVGVLSV